MKTSLCIAACALCFYLSVPGLCAQIAPPNSKTGKPAVTDPTRMPDLIESHGRISLPAPAKPFPLGEDTALSLTLKGPSPLHIFTSQSTVDAKGVLSSRIEGGDAEVTLQRTAEGQTFFNIVPQRPGKLRVSVDVSFSDGGLEQASAIVDVVATKPPTRLNAGFALGGIGRMRLDLSEYGRREFLRISATYVGIKNPLPIDIAQAQFKVTMPGGPPPIAFDPKTLEVKALRTGHALIEALYAGLSLKTCIQVRESREGYDRSDCSELSADHDRPAPTAGGSPSAYESRLPYEANDNRIGRFLADDRVEVVPPSKPLHIAMDNPVTLRLNGPAAVRIDCHPSSNSNPCEAWKGEWSRTGMPFKQNDDGTVALNLFPMNFGTNEFTFSVLFVDGGVALKKMTAEVDSGNVKPISIGQPCAAESTDADLPLALVPPKDGHEVFPGKSTLSTYACYSGVRTSVSVPTTAVKYQIRSEGKEAPIEFDASTGTVKAIRSGQALVQRSFAGLTSTTCVVVAPMEDPEASNCRHLRAKYGVPLPQLKAKVLPPETEDEPERPAAGRPGSIGVIQLGSGKTPPIPVISALAGARLSPNVRDRFNADARLTFAMAGLAVELGQPTNLPVRFTGPAVLSVKIQQELIRYSAKFGALPYEESAYMEERNANRIGRNPDGSTYLHIVPLRTGTAEFHISVLFVDGGVATRIVRLPVKLAASPQPRLVNGLEDTMRGTQFEATTLHLAAAPPGTRNLFPFLYFEGTRSSISLSPGEVEFSLKDTNAKPIVHLEPNTGKVTALRAGHTLVKTRYAGIETETCVVVVDDITAGDASTCRELRDPALSTRP
ncbi:hypothetical protein HDF16_004466 [Granulicella aggregans]|uniref:Ig-like protein group 2 n=1 Tax=Granulicella aggregans TaxID=474949 RepID=A0A7W7ZH15_9BACT|nr:hypothetical protein [Granulicella aggregans]MBB5059737.1 hypothetical protein [Granulicella aggregans]